MTFTASEFQSFSACGVSTSTYLLA